MAHEVETKVLDVQKDRVVQALAKLKAKQLFGGRLTVDWFRTAGSKEGENPWYLRIRSYSDGRSEATWKGKSEKLGASRKHREINLNLAEPEQLAAMFEEIGLEKYAHQEKDRTSWKLKGWQFDLDAYPGMPPYLEIEGTSEEHVQEALKLLSLQGHKNSAEGERVLIQTEYGLDWYDMRFAD